MEIRNDQAILPKLDSHMSIPYYSYRFNELIKILEKAIEEYDNKKKSVDQYAQMVAFIEGVNYYYRIINNGNQDEKAKRLLCIDLVESINKCIYGLLSEGDAILFYLDKDELDKHLLSYQEYLQWISNLFMMQSDVKDKAEFHLIFKLSLDLIKNKMYMNTLFSQVIESKQKKIAPSLCMVFCPSDNDLKDAFKYVPMLTHEVSHHFRYSIRKDRNKFVVGYVLNNLSKIIVRELFQQVSENNYDLVIGKVGNEMASKISEVLTKEIHIISPNFRSKGHLGQLDEIILSVFTKAVEKEEDLKGFYDGENSSFEILRTSFISLAQKTSMEWYIAESDDREEKSGKNVIASMVMDIFSDENCKELSNKYRNIKLDDKNDENDECKGEMEKLLEENENADSYYVTKKSIEIALKTIVIPAIQKTKKEFRQLGTEGMGQDCRDQVLLKLLQNDTEFEKELDGSFNKVKRGYKQEFYSFANECITLRKNINNIQYICNLPQELFCKRKKEYGAIRKVYKTLNVFLKKELKSSKKEKAYFASDHISSKIIKLGLLNREDDADTFIEHFLKIFDNWDWEKFYNIVQEYLQLYREIFADLSMCAAMQFTQTGYFTYMMDKFIHEREPADSLSRDMTLERLRVVFMAMEDGVIEASDREYKVSETKKEFMEYLEKKNSNNETERKWANELFQYLSAKLEGIEGDDRFYEVYHKKILPENWVIECRKNETIKKIGEYYNGTLDEGKLDDISNSFFDEFYGKYEKRRKNFDTTKNNVIKIMLGEDAE